MRRRRSGFLLADALMALAMVALLAAIMATAMGQQSRAARRLSDGRAAMRIAERVMLDLHTGGTAPSGADAKVCVEPVAAEAPAGLAWVRVSVQVERSRATLLGLMKADAVERPGGAP